MENHTKFHVSEKNMPNANESTFVGILLHKVRRFVGRIVFWMMKPVLKIIPRVASEPIFKFLRNYFRNKYDRKIPEKITDFVLEALLRTMSLAFALDNRNFISTEDNLANFSKKYVFKTRNGAVCCSAIFEKGEIPGNGKMIVKNHAIDDPDVTIVFKNSVALSNYLLSTDHDIVALLLDNQVEIDGNLNLAYKFMYMARHLILPLGIENEASSTAA